MMAPNLEVLNKMNFISTLAIDIMKRNYASVATDSLFKELDELCHKHVEQKLLDEQERAAKAFAFSKTAKAVIQRIQSYFDYSLVKDNHKMRLSKKEFDYMMQRLNSEEQALVHGWVETNGGFDKYVFTGFQGG
jgi:hypothetical protein